MDITKFFSNHNINVLSDRDVVSKIFRESDPYRKALDMIMGDNQFVLAVKKIDNTFGEYQKLISQFTNSLQSEYDKLRILIPHGQDAMVHVWTSDFGIRESLISLEAGVSNILASLKDTGILPYNEPFAIRLLEPSMEYASFIEDTAKKLKNISDNSKEGKAFLSSLYIAKSQFIDMSCIPSAMNISEIEIIPTSPVRRLKVPHIQQLELLRAPEIFDIEDEGNIMLLSPTANVTAKIRDVVHMVIGCNEQYLTDGNSEIFKITNRFAESISDISWLVVSDKKSFADFIDCLYFIFYEGAGTDNLRYLKEHGGVLSPDDCIFIWHIKTFRNKWLRHDRDRGNPSDIRKSKEKLQTTLTNLGLKHLPGSPQEFRFLQQRLIEEATVFMDRIINRMSDR